MIARMLLAVALAALVATPALAQDSVAEVRLDHVALHVADPGTSVAFYQGLFGLKEIPVPFRGGGTRWLVFANGVQLHIQPGRTEAIVSPQPVHFAVTVASIAPILAWLAAHGVAWVDSSGKPGAVSHLRTDAVRQIYFRDPDGYWIEVNDATR